MVSFKGSSSSKVFLLESSDDRGGIVLPNKLHHKMLKMLEILSVTHQWLQAIDCWENALNWCNEIFWPAICLQIKPHKLEKLSNDPSRLLLPLLTTLKLLKFRNHEW